MTGPSFALPFHVEELFKTEETYSYMESTWLTAVDFGVLQKRS